MAKPIAPNKINEYFALLFVLGPPGMLGTVPLIALVIWIVLGLVSRSIKSGQLKDLPWEKTTSPRLAWGWE